MTRYLRAPDSSTWHLATPSLACVCGQPVRSDEWRVVSSASLPPSRRAQAATLCASCAARRTAA